MTTNRLRTVELPEHPEFLWAHKGPQKSYDAVIVGGGGHGLATAYYLAKLHGMTNIAVLEKGWLGGGNMARNTTIIRSNYLWDESEGIYEHSLKLWEGLQEDVGYEMFFSQRGVMTLAHSVSDVRTKMRNYYANGVADIDSVWLTPEEVKEVAPIVNISQDIRYPVMGPTSLVAALPSTTGWPGVTPRPLPTWALTSSRTAKSPG
jgi:sarcosine oxidase subunit beta